MKNKGEDIISKDIRQVEETAEFEKDKLKIPHLDEKAIIVPTSKIETNTKVTQGGTVLRESRSFDATGVEFKEGKEPVRKSLNIDTLSGPAGKVSRAVVSQDGKATKDITVVKPAE